MVLLKFKNVEDLKYFISYEADHQDWLKIYQFKKINENTIYLNNKFMCLIDPNKKNNGMTDYNCTMNKKFLFTKGYYFDEEQDKFIFDGPRCVPFYDNIEFIYE